MKSHRNASCWARALTGVAATLLGGSMAIAGAICYSDLNMECCALSGAYVGPPGCVIGTCTTGAFDPPCCDIIHMGCSNIVPHHQEADEGEAGVSGVHKAQNCDCCFTDMKCTAGMCLSNGVVNFSGSFMKPAGFPCKN
jgi:hypothetical protein